MSLEEDIKKLQRRVSELEIDKEVNDYFVGQLLDAMRKGSVKVRPSTASILLRQNRHEFREYLREKPHQRSLPADRRI